MEAVKLGSPEPQHLKISLLLFFFFFFFLGGSMDRQEEKNAFVSKNQGPKFLKTGKPHL